MINNISYESPIYEDPDDLMDDDGTYMYKLYMHNNITLRLYLKASDINNNEHSSHFDIIFKFYFT